MNASVHRLHSDPDPSPAPDYQSIRNKARAAVSQEYQNAQRAEQQCASDFAMSKAIIAGRRKALDEEEAELVRQHEADMSAICERKMSARAYLDAGRAG